MLKTVSMSDQAISKRTKAIAGRIVTNNANGSSISSGNGAADELALSPIYLIAGEEYSHFAFGTNAVTSGEYWMGLYASDPDTGMPTGDPLVEAESGSITTATLTDQLIDVGASNYIVPVSGWYWIAILPSTTGTLALVSSFANVSNYGVDSMIAISQRVVVETTPYGSGLPDLTSATFVFEAGGGPHMGLKAV